MEKIIVKISWANNFGAYSDEVLGCIATGATLEEVKKGYASALEFHLDGMREDGDEIPAKLQGEYQFEYELDAMALSSSAV